MSIEWNEPGSSARKTFGPEPTPTRALTLVTCYRFYFVGSAPERFIVRAVCVAVNRVFPCRSRGRSSVRLTFRN